MPRMKGSRALVELLRAEGVEYVFANPGTTELAFIDALQDAPDIKYMLTLFEGVADVGVLATLSQIEGVPPRFAGLDKEAWQATLDTCVATGLLTGLGAEMFRIHPAPNASHDRV